MNKTETIESNTIDIRITPADLKKWKPRYDRKRALYSASERVIDELAYSAGQWTEEDLYENNLDYETESVKYVLDQWKKGSDAETEFLHLLNKGKVKTVIEFTNNDGTTQPKNLLGLWKPTKLLFGAFIALEYPTLFDEMLKVYQDTVDEAFWDEDNLIKYAPELAKDKQKAIDSFWEQLNKEWLNGDYHGDSNGVVFEIKKYYGAEEAEYQQKTDEFIFTFSVSEFHEKHCGCLEGYDDIKKCVNGKIDYKAEIISTMQLSSDSIYRKKHADHEKRAEERKRLTEYKAAQKKIADDERIARLKAMTRKAR